MTELEMEMARAARKKLPTGVLFILFWGPLVRRYKGEGEKSQEEKMKERGWNEKVVKRGSHMWVPRKRKIRED